MRSAASGLACLLAVAPAAAAPGGKPAASTTATTQRATAALVGTADEITRQVVALRGLPEKRPVKKGVLSREAIGQKLRERIAKEYTPDEIRVESRILKRLGLLPEEARYEELLLEVLMDQVAGFYDPFSRQLYLADWIGLDLQRPAIAHEVEHALQDQHFDLKKFATPLKEDGDRQLARAALVEGDGTVLMLEFLAQGMGADLDRLPGALDAMGAQLASGALAASPVFDKAPRFLRETLLFPYLAGMRFVLSLRKAGPWTQVDAAWRNPPESTEQVLHPEKYRSQEHPTAITAPPLAALAPARELRRDVLGELSWRLLFASRLTDAAAERAAAGWGGDRLVAYGSAEGPLAVVALSSWDSDDDALEAEAALRQVLPHLAGRPEVAADQPARFVKDGLAFAVERRGREVLALFGVPEGGRGAVADEVWRTWQAGPPRPAPAKAKP